MTRIFLSKSGFSDGRAVITGSDAAHIARVLRLKAGDGLTVCDMQGRDYPAVIIDADPAKVTVSLGEPTPSDTEPLCPITVFQCMPKGDKLDTVVQKSVELGATEIVPVLSERCVARPDASSMAKRLERLRRIAESAASQCGRGRVPEVGAMISYAEACARLRDGLCFICYEGEGTEYISKLVEKKDYSRMAFLIGPEGGLSAGETELAKDLGIPLAGLGKRILRTETAASFVLSALSVLTYRG